MSFLSYAPRKEEDKRNHNKEPTRSSFVSLDSDKVFKLIVRRWTAAQNCPIAFLFSLRKIDINDQV